VDSGTDTGNDSAADSGADAADAALAPGFYGPVAYTSRADALLPASGYASYAHFEDFETGAIAAPGVAIGLGGQVLGSSSLIDSVDGDDGVVDGVCAKAGGTCYSSFHGSGTIEFVFDATALGGLPTHVSMVWTDGATACDAIFEAYDATDTLIGSRSATAVGNADNTGDVTEDRYFGVVHPAGVKSIRVRSSGGGVEADNLFFAR